MSKIKKDYLTNKLKINHFLFELNLFSLIDIDNLQVCEKEKKLFNKE